MTAIFPEGGIFPEGDSREGGIFPEGGRGEGGIFPEGGRGEGGIFLHCPQTIPHGDLLWPSFDIIAPFV